MKELTNAGSGEGVKEAPPGPCGYRLDRTIGSDTGDAKRVHGFPAGVIAAVVPLSSARFKSR